MACRLMSDKYEVTMKYAMGKRRLLDGFKTGVTKIMAKELVNDELVVSFLNLPAYITFEEILQKVRETVQSLPYSIKFNTALRPEYFRVVRDKLVKVCRVCIHPQRLSRVCATPA